MKEPCRVLTRDELLHDPELLDPDGSPDDRNGISREVVRCRYQGMRAVALGCDVDSTTQIAALLDLLDMHLSTPAQHAGVTAAPDRVALLLGGRPNGSEEVVDAVRTLVACQVRGPRVQVLEHDNDRGWVPLADPPVDLQTLAQQSGFDRLLAAVPDQPPQLVTDLVTGVGHPALRARPVLSRTGCSWSLRLEGLQVGVVSAQQGWLGVGSPGGLCEQAKAWQAATSTTGRLQFDAGSCGRAVTVLRAFAVWWLASPDAAAVVVRQDEPALESRILRGHVPVRVRGRRLQLLRPDPVVSWGSEFPTRWGRNGHARHLDGLLRDGSTPWAVEMQVQGGVGAGRYYRHAVVQAVLDRQFIREATPLHDWFARQGLDATVCEAAAVVPRMHPAAQSWRIRLERVSALFGVPLVHVPSDAADVAHLPLPSATSPGAPTGAGTSVSPAAPGAAPTAPAARRRRGAASGRRRRLSDVATSPGVGDQQGPWR